ncbi:MAG: leucine-rich repeat domain-containing protein [Chlamydiia bacterium]|nr:leucine-rich repeat domain-containing protein [Chlamydiia bacterium]
MFYSVRIKETVYEVPGTWLPEPIKVSSQSCSCEPYPLLAPYEESNPAYVRVARAITCYFRGGNVRFHHYDPGAMVHLLHRHLMHDELDNYFLTAGNWKRILTAVRPEILAEFSDSIDTSDFSAEELLEFYRRMPAALRIDSYIKFAQLLSVAESPEDVALIEERAEWRAEGDYKRLYQKLRYYGCSTYEQLREIEESEREGHGKSSLRLEAIPFDFTPFSRLKSLHLDGSVQISLPDSFWNLTTLQVLKIAHSRLNTLSPEIARLQNLRILNLSMNRIEELPDSLGSLQKLNALILDYNLITALPETLGFLPRLRYLSVLGNQIRSYPDSFVHLRTLRFFDGRLNDANSELRYEMRHLAGAERRARRLKWIRAEWIPPAIQSRTDKALGTRRYKYYL